MNNSALRGVCRDGLNITLRQKCRLYENIVYTINTNCMSDKHYY